MKAMSKSDVETRLTGELPQWTLADKKITRTYASRGWPGTLMLVNTIAYLAEVAWHHPKLIVGYKSVTVELTTHSTSGVTERDLELAQQIEETLAWRSVLPVTGSSSQL